MRGFLSVLDAPRQAAHFSARKQDGNRAAAAADANDPLAWLSARAEMVVRRMGRQDEVLNSITEIVRRINGGVIRLQIRSEAVRLTQARRLGHPKGEHR